MVPIQRKLKFADMSVVDMPILKSILLGLHIKCKPMALQVEKHFILLTIT